MCSKNPEQVMLLMFPAITLALFAVGAVIFWAFTQWIPSL